MGKVGQRLQNLIRILNLSNEVRALLIEGQLEMGHARALLTLAPEQQTALAQKIVEKRLSDAERLAQLSKQPPKVKSHALC